MTTNTYAVIVLSLAGLLAERAGGQTSPVPAPSPNILFILADDLGWMDVGFQGNRWVETPSLDRLAAQGMVFSQAYSYPLCTPTRAALMTGKHPARLHMTRVFDEFDRGEVDKPSIYHPVNRQKPGGWDELSPATCPDLPHAEVTIGELARAAGYRTAFMGKWHLGFGAHYPEHQGFDTVFRGDHWSDYFAPYAGERVQCDSVPEEHIADRLATEAVRFIKADPTRPFLLCAWFYDVHTPIEAKKELVDHYARKLAPDAGIHPVYAAMVHSLDENVGRILAALDEQGIADDTLVLFMSDNGGLARTGSGAVFDPRDHINRHPAKSTVDLATCQASLGQTFAAPGEPFEVSFSVASVPAGVNASIKAELLREESDGRWTPVKSQMFAADDLRTRSSGSLRVETNAPAAGQQLMLRLNRPPGLPADAIRINSTENDSCYSGALHIDDRAAAGDLVLRLVPLGQPRPAMTQLTTNAPLRGQKIDLYEGGIRVPFAVRWPGVVAPGSRCLTPVVAMDILPTFAEILGVTPPSPLDGVSIRALLDGSGAVTREALYWHYPHYMYQQGGVAIREGDFKLIEFYVDGRVELYNLAEDMGETKNLAGAMPERVEAMRDQLRRWQVRVGASMPSRTRP